MIAWNLPKIENEILDTNFPDPVEVFELLSWNMLYKWWPPRIDAPLLDAKNNHNPDSTKPIQLVMGVMKPQTLSVQLQPYYCLQVCREWMLAPRLDASPACHSSPLLVMQPTFQTVLKAFSDPEAKPTQGAIVTRNCTNSVHIQVWSMSVGIKALEVFDITESMNGATYSLVPLREKVKILIRYRHQRFIRDEVDNTMDPLENAL